MRFGLSFALITAAILLVPSNVRAWAHEGDEHDGSAKIASVAPLPRAETSSDTFELVALASAGEVIIYLDRFATNEPVRDALVVIETPQGSVEARRASDGTYRLAAPWTGIAGRYDLIATVTKDGEADVLTFTLNIPSANQAVAATSSGLSGSAFALGIRDRISPGDSGSSSR
jgi:hypothetical protein